MSEKRLAFICVLFSAFVIVGYSGVSSYVANLPLNLSTRDALYFMGSNILTLTLPFVCAWIPYIFVRPAAVTGSALSALGLFIFFAVTSSSMSDPKSVAATWMIYFFWLMGASLAGIYPALFKPGFFTKTAMGAFLMSILFTLAVSFIIGLTVSKLL